MGILGQESITVNRDPGGSFVGGYYTPGVAVPLTGISASFQPVMGDELLELAEGDRNRQAKRFFSTFQFKKNDLITQVKTGSKFEVKTVEDFDGYRLPHFTGIALLVDDQNATI